MILQEDEEEEYHLQATISVTLFATPFCRREDIDIKI